MLQISMVIEENFSSLTDPEDETHKKNQIPPKHNSVRNSAQTDVATTPHLTQKARTRRLKTSLFIPIFLDIGT